MFPSSTIRAFLLTLFLCSFLACSRAQEYSVGAGEIRFDGTVVSHDQAGQSLVLNVSSFTLPNGKSSQLAKVKAKTILFAANTVVLFSGKTSPKSISDLPIGHSIVVIGKDVGSAKDFSARVIAWDEAEPSTPTADTGNSKALKIKAGETLFEGKLTGILTATNLTASVSTMTSANGEKTDLFPLESKTILLDANTTLRSQNDPNRKLQFEDLKIGDRLTLVGKIVGDNMKAREIAVSETNDSTTEGIGMVIVSHDVSLLIDKADEASAANNFEEAIKILNRAIQAADGEDDRPGRALTLERLGNAYGEINQVEKAAAAFEGALVIWRAADNKQNESTTLSNLGLLWVNNGQLEKAVPILEKSVQLGRRGDSRGFVLSLQNLADAYSASQKYDKTLATLTEALPLIRDGKKDVDNEAIVTARIARLYGASEKPQQALEYAEKAEALLDEMKDKQYQASVMYYLGSAYLMANRQAKGLEMYKRALAVYTELGSKEDIDHLTAEIADIEKPAPKRAP